MSGGRVIRLVNWGHIVDFGFICHYTGYVI